MHTAVSHSRVHARVVLSVLNTGGGHGCVARPCCFDRLAYGHVARHGNLSHLKLGKNIALFSYGRIARPCLSLWCEHGLRHACVPCRVDLKTFVSRTHLVIRC
ncbi:hypothetical protein F383_36776 [Gossypium arboreum]|uniref:Uncharacterized protein n=1 Tax=Gossypium arboreum TaxID=29729 RepID=A0A0B0MF27_GOSAR|nr:hypothetical protein F383_36776 [Gossypium arboreum]